MKEKDKLRKRKSREKFMKDFPLLHKEKVKQESKEEKKGDKKRKCSKQQHWWGTIGHWYEVCCTF